MKTAKGALALSLSLAASAVLATDWYVARSGTYVDEHGVEHAAKTSIAAAIDWDSGAAAGDTV